VKRLFALNLYVRRLSYVITAFLLLGLSGCGSLKHQLPDHTKDYRSHAVIYPRIRFPRGMKHAPMDDYYAIPHRPDLLAKSMDISLAPPRILPLVQSHNK